MLYTSYTVAKSWSFHRRVSADKRKRISRPAGVCFLYMLYDIAEGTVYQIASFLVFAMKLRIE